MKEAQGRVIRLTDYQPPDFLIEQTELDFDLYEDHAIVVASLRLRRNPLGKAGAALVLSGQGLSLEGIWVDDETLADDRYQVDEDSLRIEAVPDNFCLRTRARILPQENQQQVLEFVESRSDAAPRPIESEWGRAAGPGRQILPGDHGMDGFYYALLAKR